MIELLTSNNINRFCVMRLKNVCRTLGVACAVLSGHGAAWAAPFTGAFYGQGEGCWGGLFIREKTIEWEADDFTCRRTGYTILDQDIHHPFQNGDHIAFKLNHPNRDCRFPYIALYYHEPPGEAATNASLPEIGRWYYDWSSAAFATDEEYRAFPYKDYMNGSFNAVSANVFVCNLPFMKKPFPFGKPLFGP